MPSKPSRFDPLDVLRGLAVLGMALSGMVPNQELPAWMYHAQLPPPSRQFNDQVFGITWVDLVFPFFLFSMGAAIPLALSRRLDEGASRPRVIFGLGMRGLLLASYALIGQHLRPYVLSSNPHTRVWLLTLAGFFLIGLILIRWPERVPRLWRRVLTAVGWIGSAWIILFWTYPDGTRGFANYRNDVILMVLANVAVSGGVIWMFTRTRPWARWACFAAVAVIFLTYPLPGLSNVIWNWDPTTYLPFRVGPFGRFIPIFYHFEYHKYLLLVLPGTFVGDLILRREPASALRRGASVEDLGAIFALTLVGPAAALLACVGLLAREVVSTGLLLGAVLLGAAIVIPRSRSVRESLPARLFAFGAPLLAIGLLAEPLGGGIRKDETTFSYFLVSGGLSALCLASLTSIWPLVTRSRVWRIVTDVGTNPIMGYLVITNLTMAVVGLTGLEYAVNARTDNPWLLLAWAMVKTLFVALATAWFTRRRVFLRA